MLNFEVYIILKTHKIATPLALKPLHCLSGSPCLTSCLLLLLRQNSNSNSLEFDVILSHPYFIV